MHFIEKLDQVLPEAKKKNTKLSDALAAAAAKNKPSQKAKRSTTAELFIKAVEQIDNFSIDEKSEELLKLATRAIQHTRNNPVVQSQVIQALIKLSKPFIDKAPPESNKKLRNVVDTILNKLDDLGLSDSEKLRKALVNTREELARTLESSPNVEEQSKDKLELKDENKGKGNDSSKLELKDDSKLELKDEKKNQTWYDMLYGEPEAKTDEVNGPGVNSASNGPDLKRHQFSRGEKNIAIVKKMGQSAVVRVRGKTANGRKAIYRYLTVDAKALQDVTGDGNLNPSNIWQYVVKNYQKNPEEFRRKFISDADTAFERLDQVSGVQQPKDLNTYIKRYVGGTRKDMLINAVRRSQYSEDLLPIVSTLNNEQIARLFEYYNSVSKTQITSGHIKQFMTNMKRRFSPFEESLYVGDDIDESVLLEIDLGKYLNKLTGRDPEMEKYIRQAIRYDRLIERIGIDPPRFEEVLQDMRINTSQYPFFQEMEQEEQPAEKGEKEEKIQNQPENQRQQITPREKTQSLKVTPADLKESQILLNLQNKQVFSQLLRMASKSPQLIATLSKFKDITGLGVKPTSKPEVEKLQREVAELWAHLSSEFKEWIQNGVKAIVGQNKQQIRQKRLRRFGKIKEEYARAIQNDESLEETRTHVQDLANAALNIYTEHYNLIKGIPVNYVHGSDKLLDKLLGETKVAYQKYRTLIKECEIPIEFKAYQGTNLFEALINVISYTSDPLTEDGLTQIHMDRHLLVESFLKNHINVEGRSSGFVPLSNIL